MSACHGVAGQDLLPEDAGKQKLTLSHSVKCCAECAVPHFVQITDGFSQELRRQGDYCRYLAEFSTGDALEKYSRMVRCGKMRGCASSWVMRFFLSENDEKLGSCEQVRRLKLTPMGCGRRRPIWTD